MDFGFDKKVGRLEQNVVIEELERYCLRICCIQGLDTYIISPQNYDALLADRKLLKQFYSTWVEETLRNLIQIAADVPDGRLYPAVVRHKNRWKKFEWEPVLCYQNRDVFYHVFYRNSWMCRECGHILHTSIIMPMAEADAVFYSGVERNHIEVAPFFQKIPCTKCGRPLQNHLFLLNDIGQ